MKAAGHKHGSNWKTILASKTKPSTIKLSCKIGATCVATATHTMRPTIVRNSATGTRSQVVRVRTEYPNQIHYSG